MINLLKDQRTAERIFVEITLDAISPIELSGKGLPVSGLIRLTHQKNRAMTRDVVTLSDLVFGVVGKKRATGIGPTGGQRT